MKLDANLDKLPLGGRVIPRVSGRNYHVFGRIKTTPDDQTYLPPTIYVPSCAWSTGPCLEQFERTFLVSTSAQELLRQQDNDDAFPTTQQVVASTGVRRSAGVRARITVGTQMAIEQWIVDIGQRLEVVGDAVTVELLASADAVLVTPINIESPIFPGGGVWTHDTIVGASIEAIETSVGAKSAEFTQVVVIPATQALRTAVPIPAGARRIEGYMQAAGVYPPTVDWWIGDPTTGAAMDLGPWAWDVAGQRRGLSVRPPAASHLVFDADQTSDRVFTLVWTIQP